MNKLIIDDFHLSDLENPIHPSVFNSYEDYNIFILKFPRFEKQRIETYNKSYIISHNKYFVYNKKQKSLDEVDAFSFLYEDINSHVNSLMALVLELYNSIEQMEDTFYESAEIKNFNQHWFKKKNELNKISRILNKAIEEFKKFIIYYKKDGSFLNIHFDDLLEHLERTNRSVQHGLEKLDALYNFYVSNNNEKINRTIYTLTVISAIFLPLNLIVGFFGMNTTALPFKDYENGTFNVIMILLIVLVIPLFLNFLLKKLKR